ncbi:kinase-like domain-containing protein [Globomyces pollinis-pini]|nr:kinase-like domain-containing protein [Globomyces pollinis-pini]
MDSEIFFNVIKEMDTDEHISEGSSDSDSNYSSIDKRKKTKFNVSKNKIPKYNLTVDALYAGTVVGYGTTGQVIKLKDSNIVVKHCDSYNNRKGFKMLRNEIIIYEKLSLLNLPYVPHYYGKCEIHGQYFVLLEYIPGKHCDWRMSAELTEKFNFIIRDLNSIGVVHNNLRPSHVLLTLDGDIKLIGFGKANIN